MRLFLSVILILTCFLPGISQVIIPEEQAACEGKLAGAFEELYTETNDQQRIAKSAALQEYFGSLLTKPDYFHYPFDSLKWVGKIISPDKKIRIITWNVPLSDGTHRYFGFIQHAVRKKVRTVNLFTLKDDGRDIKDPESAVYTPDNWPGALYYDILATKRNGQVLYTLLGFDFNDRYSNKKIIDVLVIDKNMHARFGEPVFETQNDKMKNRIIFEFSSQAVMTLRWDPQLKMIVADHLSPIEPGLEGVYKFYGPDESYDGYKFRDGMWKFFPDVEVRNE
jgi:hypothetical protein